jgi:holo-[acyl-carrier protein] synthase
MQYVGIDVIEISRIEKAVKELGEKFLQRVYTLKEAETYKNRVASLAVRFAAKEAVMKALGSGNIGYFPNIEILSEPSGKPYIALYGKVKELADELNIKDFSVSLSHSRNQAIAVVIGNRDTIAEH